jgi:hypothetical protein
LEPASGYAVAGHHPVYDEEEGINDNYGSQAKVRMFERLKAGMERNIVPVRELKGTRRKWNYFNKYTCNQKPSL